MSVLIPNNISINKLLFPLLGIIAFFLNIKYSLPYRDQETAFIINMCLSLLQWLRNLVCPRPTPLCRAPSSPNKPPAPSTSCLCCCASDSAAATCPSLKRCPRVPRTTHKLCRTHMLTLCFFTSAPPADSRLLWAKWRWDCLVSGGATQCAVPHFQPVTVWSGLQRYRGP